MNKIYLLLISRFENERNSLVLICSNREVAEQKKTEFENNWKVANDPHEYYIKEVFLDPEVDILFDAVEEEKSIFKDSYCSN